MSAPVANCPSCGAEIRFRWAGAVQTVCEHCSSILVRRDVDLAAVGRVSEPPPVTSRIHLGTQGTYQQRRFTVVGRIAYAWESGAWSEWHLAFADGRSGWLSDAQDEYAVTFAVPGAPALPPADTLRPGDAVPLGIPGGPFSVGTVTRARYAGVEGELPFEYWGKGDTPFVDLRSDKGTLATIDYSESPPLLFAGEFVEFAALALKDLREPGLRRIEGTQALNCPGCGGTVTLRRPGESVNAVCDYCLRVLDVSDSEALRVVQKFNDCVRVQPLIPLGSTGRMHGAEWTVLGMQQLTIRVEGVPYSWREYLLHAPERGFRYLTEYDGHWNDVVVLKAPPAATRTNRKEPVTLNGERFRPFQHATSETTFVLGEFPWQVRQGDKAKSDDYVSPPRLLSREETPGEVSWSLGEYLPPARVWEAFKLPGNPPAPRGTYANQPSPHAGHRRLWPLFTVFAVLLLAAVIFRTAGGNQPVFREEGLVAQNAVPEQAAPLSPFQVQGQPGPPPMATRDAAEDVYVSPPFTLGGRPSTLRVAVRTDVSNAWAGFEMTLVEQNTGRTREFSEEVGYYAGVEDGERWSEGSRNGSATVPAVPAGTYRLVVAPQASAFVRYDVHVTRDAPLVWLYLLALVALLVPPAVRGLQHASFEQARWMESDYAPVSTDDEEE
ncbi:MAG TPA: DUF4178 domain-containing protein [Longimicrobium sp.]|nr:DUF4178 domain-containing protein [Longimicrobium sp.]